MYGSLPNKGNKGGLKGEIVRIIIKKPLLADWELAVHGKTIFTIDPLK